MYRVEFIDNCNKLRNKWFIDLTNCDLEVYNFVVGIYDDNQDLLDKKYLILTDLERSFYGKLSQIGANYLIENIVTQPVIRTFFDNSKLVQIGNNYIESFLIKSVTPVYNGSTQLLNFDEFYALNVGYRFCKKIFFSLEFQNSAINFDSLDFSVRIFLGNVEVGTYNIDKYNVEGEVFYDNINLNYEGFINTDVQKLHLNISGYYNAGGIPQNDLRFILIPYLF